MMDKEIRREWLNRITGVPCCEHRHWLTGRRCTADSTWSCDQRIPTELYKGGVTTFLPRSTSLVFCRQHAVQRRARLIWFFRWALRSAKFFARIRGVCSRIWLAFYGIWHRVDCALVALINEAVIVMRLGMSVRFSRLRRPMPRASGLCAACGGRIHNPEAHQYQVVGDPRITEGRQQGRQP